MKRILFISLTFLSFCVQAQFGGIKLQESKVYTMTTARVQNDYILPDNHGGFITISTKRSGFLANPLVFESYANHYNNQLEAVKSKTFKLNKGSIKGSIKGAFVNGNTLALINMEVNYRKKYFSFKKILSDIDKGEAVKEEEFFKINWIYPKNEVNLYVNLNSLYYQKLKYYSDVNFFNPKIFIKFSQNNQFFSIVYRDINEQQTTYHLTVFDKKFQLKYQTVFSYPVSTKLFYINDIVVNDSDGTVYVIAKIYKTDPMKKNRFINTDNLKTFTLFKASSKGVINKSFKPEKVVEKLHLALQDQLYVFGFYRNRYIDLNDIDGITHYNISTTSLRIDNQSFQKFSQKPVATEYKKNHKKTKNHTMIIRNWFLTDKGSLIINAEDMYIPLMMKKKDRETDIREIVSNIFSVKIDKTGNILWSKKIFKHQIVKPRLALHSYFSCMIDNNNYIFFTDSRLKKPSNNDPFYLNQKDLQNLNGIKISPYGDIQTGIVKENKRSKFRFMPIEGIMINPREAIIPAKDHQYIKFYKISF